MVYLRLTYSVGKKVERFPKRGNSQLLFISPHTYIHDIFCCSKLTGTFIS